MLQQNHFHRGIIQELIVDEKRTHLTEVGKVAKYQQPV